MESVVLLPLATHWVAMVVVRAVTLLTVQTVTWMVTQSPWPVATSMLQAITVVPTAVVSSAAMFTLTRVKTAMVQKHLSTLMR